MPGKPAHQFAGLDVGAGLLVFPGYVVGDWAELPELREEEDAAVEVLA